MPSLFDQMFEAAAAPLFDHWFGTTVRLQRGPLTSDEFTATWSAQEYQSIAEEVGLSIAVKKRVYRFAKDVVLFHGSAIEPRAGDILVDGDDSMTILAVEGKPAAETEPGGYRWLVRTNRLA